MRDIGHIGHTRELPEKPHGYGPNVHILDDAVAFTLLARLCEGKTAQPDFNRIIRVLYERLLDAVLVSVMPRAERTVVTRMAAETSRARAEMEVLDPNQRVVIVDVIRGGILPGAVCFDRLNDLLDPDVVRQDHLLAARVAAADGSVSGTDIPGGKIGGDIEDVVLMLPDPMAATGSTLDAVLAHYRDKVDGTPRAIVAMHVIVTPEYLSLVREKHPEVQVFALRVDRGLSDAEVLAMAPGASRDERALTDHGYIVPGGGGFGELLNNSWV
ncbi:MAG: uracil phosphoribosyltransferase [Deltaproteobacteria bacterium]|nr:MAG: uracil phosphoribosyltransferase [Deltaproteobacteria bacterium]